MSAKPQRWAGSRSPRSGAEAERRALEEACCAGSARRASARGIAARPGRAGRAVRRRPALRLARAGRDVAAPRGSRRRARSRRRRPATGQLTTRPDEQADDADGEARPARGWAAEAAALLVPRALFQASPSLRGVGIQSLQVWPRQRRNSWRNDALAASVRRPRRAPRPYSSQRSSTSGAPRRSSRSPAATAACPPRGPCASRRSRACRRRTAASARGRGGRAGPRLSSTSRFGSTLAPTRKKTSS